MQFADTVACVTSSIRIDRLPLSLFWSDTWWEMFAAYWAARPVAGDSTHSFNEEHMAVYRDNKLVYPPNYATYDPDFADAFSHLRPRAREVGRRCVCVHVRIGGKGVGEMANGSWGVACCGLGSGRAMGVWG